MRVTASDRYYYAGMCDYLLRTVIDACTLEWVPYRGNLTTLAVFQAKLVMRRARHMGMYPTTAQLDAELRQAA